MDLSMKFHHPAIEDPPLAHDGNFQRPKLQDAAAGPMKGVLARAPADALSSACGCLW